MIAALKEIFFLLVFFMIGFTLCRTKLVKSEHSKALSTLIVYGFLPATIIRSFTKNFTIANISTYGLLLLVATVLLLVNIGLSFLFAKLFGREPYEKAVYRYSSIIPNGNLGYGFSEGLLGTVGVLHFSIFNIPNCVYCYTFGYALLTKQKLSLKKLLNPVTIAMVLGCILGLLPFDLPDVLQTLLDKAAACTIPLCMVVIGIVISDFKILKLFSNWRAVLFALIRMVALPLVLRFLLPLLPLEQIVIQMAVLLYALPCGMNSILFAKMVDEDVHFGAELVLVSNVIAIVSIPLITLGLF